VKKELAKNLLLENDNFFGHMDYIAQSNGQRNTNQNG
jgi:hypothetical protein